MSTISAKIDEPREGQYCTNASDFHFAIELTMPFFNGRWTSSSKNEWSVPDIYSGSLGRRSCETSIKSTSELKYLDEKKLEECFSSLSNEIHDLQITKEMEQLSSYYYK